MKSILFVCLGNICRSPMAEEVFRQYVINQGKADEWKIDSAAIGAWHIGELPDHRMRKAASSHGYELTMRARQVCKADFDRFDYIVVMDEENVRDLQRVAADIEKSKKILRMATFLSAHPGQHTIPDPYYGDERGFHLVIELLEDAVKGLWEKVR